MNFTINSPSPKASNFSNLAPPLSKCYLGHHIMKWAKLNFVTRHYDSYVLRHKGHMLHKKRKAKQNKHKVNKSNNVRLALVYIFTRQSQCPKLLIYLCLSACPCVHLSVSLSICLGVTMAAVEASVFIGLGYTISSRAGLGRPFGWAVRGMAGIDLR